jgi:hypothetical protein
MRTRKEADAADAQAFRLDQIARRNNIGTSVVRSEIRKGKLEASKLGDQPRSPTVVTKEAEQKWLATRRVKPTNGQAK